MNLGWKLAATLRSDAPDGWFARSAESVAVDEVQAIAFPDVDGDGRFDIVTIVSAETGMGPDGAVPFKPL